jgi:IS5 family transposase
MLKFQDNYNTTIESFEDFILIVFVLIDDLYAEQSPNLIKNRRNIDCAKLSDTETITISICGELIGVDSEKAWFSFVKKNYSHFFPKLGSRSRFNRRRRDLLQVTEILRQKIIEKFSMNISNQLIVDSFPLPVCKFGRAKYSKTFRDDGADYGRCASKKETYYGYKVHALTTIDGYITSFEITSASVDDREGLRDLVCDRSNLVIFADKGYISKALSEELAEKNIDLLPLKRSNSKNNWTEQTRRFIFKLRRRIETAFSQLTEQLNAERVRAKSLRGLCTRIENKILAHNLCMVINKIFLKACDIGKIKSIIF